ncbi:tail fiber domain-containing protein, partial [Mesorhizobium sp. M7A.F.Ca.CA.002.05.1.1]
MCAPDAPAPPDPKETSAASTATNVGTAIANANLGNVNQVTPDGSLNYSQTGTYKWNDPYTGKSYDIPTYTATQTLSGTGQAIKDQTDQAKLNLGELAAGQSSFLKDWLAKPVDLS